MPTWGTQVNPAHFVEIPDAAYVDSVSGTTKTKRPAAGTTLQVKNATTLVDLPPITTDAYGFWGYSLSDETVTQILVSADGVTWVGPLESAEAKTAALTAGSQASSALALATNADQKAQQALDIVGTGGSADFEDLFETAPGVYPTPTGTKTRRFIGQVRPTEAQGRRAGDRWMNVVWVTA